MIIPICMHRFVVFKKQIPSHDWIDLTIIIPIDLNYRSQDILQRIKNLIHIVKNQPIRIILGCNANPKSKVDKLKNIIKSYKNITIITHETQIGHLSRLRNIALLNVKSQYVLFLDIDIYINIEQILDAFSEVRTHSAQVCMYPCLYLSQKGNKYIKRLSLEEFKQAYYNFRRDLILHLAFPSSIIITDLKSVQDIKGFDEQFIGHGYEDFDFILRLFKYKGLIEYQTALLSDETYLAPMMATGFRAILAESQLGQIFQKKYFLHIHHKKDKNSFYHRQRKINQQYFLSKLNQQIKKDTPFLNTSPPYLLNIFWHSLIQHQVKRSEYSALWAEIQGHRLRKIKI